MRTEYRITKGQQYDSDGALVAHASLYAQYTHEGAFDCGEPVAIAHIEAISEAVSRVIATGTPETLVLGEPERVRPASPEITGCRLWTADQGCPLHGELCR